MKKTDKNFKMPNAYKNMLGGIKNTEMRNLWKKSFIQAAVAVEDYKKSKFKDKE
jgi:hypothetical protein